MAARRPLKPKGGRSSLLARTRIALLAQTRYERLPYKEKVPSSQLGQGTRLRAMELQAVVTSLAMRTTGGLDPHMVHQIRRVSSNGRASGFQPDDGRSNRLIRSKDSGCSWTVEPMAWDHV